MAVAVKSARATGVQARSKAAVVARPSRVVRPVAAMAFQVLYS